MNEREFLEHYNIHDFDLPLVTVDLVIFSIIDQALQVLLVRRGDHPFKGRWALPGGFIDIGQDADLEAAALRKLKEKTAVTSPYLEQLATVGGPTRDPRGWSVTVVYFALIEGEGEPLGPDARWTAVEGGIPSTLAFDHQSLFDKALARLRNKVAYTALPVHLLPPTFTLTDLQGQPGFSGSHDKTIQLVEAGSYEVGALNEQVWKSRVEAGEVNLTKVEVIWRTPAYYDYHWVINPRVKEVYGEEFIGKVQAALLKLDPTIPEQKEILDLFGAAKFIPTQNENYAEIEAVGREIGKIK